MTLTDQQAERYREAAQQRHAEDGVLEIDDGAPVSHSPDGDGGAYVQAWVWVYDHECEGVEK